MKEGLWEETLDRIRETIPENEFSSWFNRLVFGKEEDGKITLYVPSAFVRDRFEGSYRTTIEDMESIINQLRKCNNPFNCPHGRPTLITMTKTELDKRFHRIV